MKNITRIFWLALVVALLGGAIVLPLNYHIVVYDNQTHLISKDNWSWDHTYFNLDKNRSKWAVVLSSPTLRAYFTKHYRDALFKRLRGSADHRLRSLWHSGRNQSRQAMEQGSKWVRERGAAEIDKLKHKTQSNFKEWRKKAKELLP
jgi:hypothetical protein